MWRAWDLDASTIAWAGMAVWFVLWEAAAILRGDYWGTLTAHLRPLFLSVPPLWWIGVGLWLWLGVHIFAPSAETWLADTVVRGLVK